MFFKMTIILLTLNAYKQHKSRTILSNSLFSTFKLSFSISVFNLVAKFCKKKAPKNHTNCIITYKSQLYITIL